MNSIRRWLKSLFPTARTPVRVTEWASILLAGRGLSSQPPG